MDTQEPRIVFVCRGPYCRERGSRGVLDRLRGLLRDVPRGRPVLAYHCFGQCDLGPNVVLYPEAVWYAGVAPDDAAAIAAHALGGAPVERLELPVEPGYREQTLASIREVLPHLLPHHARPDPARRRGWWPFRRSD